MNKGGTSKRGKRVSIDTKDVLDIQPVVYSFKGPPHSHASGSIVTAAPPPQWLYHDHVMGVIWMIFHKEKNFIGISQLQWCLEFLMELKNSQGEYTGDVEICIQAIQDDLIEQYAKLGPALEKSIEEKSLRKENQSSVAAEDIQSAMFEETRDERDGNETVLVVNESRKSIVTDITNSANNNNVKEDKDETFITAYSQGITGTSTPKDKVAHASIQKTENRNNISEKHGGCQCSTKNTAQKKEETLSFTYNEMVSRGPAPCIEPYFIEDTYNDQLIEYSGEAQDAGIIADMNSSELLNFLTSSRQKQAERINNDMETLRALERFLENINTSGFAFQNAHDLAVRLKNLENEDVVGNAEETIKIDD